MYDEKPAKIECLISALISTNIWIFILFQLDEPIYNNKLLFLTVFILPLILQFLSIIIAIVAYVSSTKHHSALNINIFKNTPVKFISQEISQCS